MCGFLGVYRPQPLAGDVSLLRARRYLERRGPDSLKEWSSSDGRVELLHARLAIVDGGGLAHQPMTDPETGTTVAFNGEIYNYAELRTEFSYPYATASDTEAILAVYRWHGLDALAQLRGMFALVLVDGPSGDVHLARDLVGKKPLFIADWDGITLFGSSVQALIAASGRPRPLADGQALEDYWIDGHVHPTRSLVVGCRPLVPGEIVTLRRNGGRAASTIAPPVRPGATTSVREEVSELLATAVRRRLRNNPQPVSLLSGGVDSTVVTQAVRKEGSVRALTLGALVPYTLDERYARYAARRLGLPLEIVSPSMGRIEDEIDFCFGLQDEPLGMMSFYPLALLLRAMKPHGRILFTGDGGDEVFLGYGRPSDWTTTATGSNDRAEEAVSCGPALPAWMSPWGRATVTKVLVGHMFTKLDRASAEQGIEVRCPLLDWDVMSFARSLPADVLLGCNRPKHVLKDQLVEWPAWFVDRPKVGFAYHLRWAWAFRGFAGLRERVDPAALETWASRLPSTLRVDARRWKSPDIWRNFPTIWKLLAWSAFLRRQHADAIRAPLRDAS